VAHKVSAVINIGSDPVVAAAGGHDIWAYNKNDDTISEVDATTNRLVKTTTIVGIPDQCCSLFTGPVLAADASGVWFVNGGAYDQPRLTHIPAGEGKERQYPLDLTPTGVAVGGGAVWMVGYRGRDHQVLRVDPATDRLTARTIFPAGARVDSIAFAYGAVWVTSSSTATVYRLDARTGRRTWSAAVGVGRASRPEIVPYRHDIEFRLTENGGTDVSINSINPSSTVLGNYGAADWGEYAGDRAYWWYDWPSGTLTWEDGENMPAHGIQVTQTQPVSGGPLADGSRRQPGRGCLRPLALGATAAALPARRSP